MLLIFHKYLKITDTVKKPKSWLSLYPLSNDYYIILLNMYFLGLYASWTEVINVSEMSIEQWKYNEIFKNQTS